MSQKREKVDDTERISRSMIERRHIHKHLHWHTPRHPGHTPHWPHSRSARAEQGTAKKASSDDFKKLRIRPPSADSSTGASSKGSLSRLETQSKQKRKESVPGVDHNHQPPQLNISPEPHSPMISERASDAKGVPGSEQSPTASEDDEEHSPLDLCPSNSLDSIDSGCTLGPHSGCTLGAHSGASVFSPSSADLSPGSASSSSGASSLDFSGPILWLHDDNATNHMPPLRSVTSTPAVTLHSRYISQGFLHASERSRQEQHSSRRLFHPKGKAYFVRDQDSSAFDAHYLLGQVIGKGAMGTVHDCVQLKTGRTFACKVVRKDKLRRPQDLVQARKEFLLQKRTLPHPHIVTAEQLYEDKKCIFLVMEQCSGGDLFSFLETQTLPISEPLAAALFSQMVAAVQACHEHGLLHRDLKLENFLVAKKHIPNMHILNMHNIPNKSGTQDVWQGPCLEGQPIPHLKLTDFGSALLLAPGKQALGTIGGSTMYQAPEVLSRKKHDYKADMWSLGVLLYALLSGTFPFRAPSDSLLAGMIKRGLVSMSGPEWAGVSAEAKALVMSLLQCDPKKRASIGDMFFHPWVQRHSVALHSSPEKEVEEIWHGGCISVGPISRCIAGGVVH